MIIGDSHNACVLWTTHYLGLVVDATAATGHEVTEDVIAHLSPVRHEHMNPYGTYTFDVEPSTNSRTPL